MKYAFIYDCDIPSGPNHHCMVACGENVNLVAGVSPVEEAIPLVKKLVAEGYETIGFCGAFNEPILERIREAAGPGVKISPMMYFPDQLEMLGAMNSFREYGILIQADGLVDGARFQLSNGACNAKVCFVPDWDHAREVVHELFSEGIYFIECCGYFTAPMVRDIIAMTCGQIPVGSTGLGREE